jgi:pimeloyl-ACP methyl ester carboxylesterase
MKFPTAQMPDIAANYPNTSIIMAKVVIFLISLLLLIACNNRLSEKPHSDIDSATKKVEEKSLMNLGGEKQYVEITGESDKNPVLLFIHGGPGWPQTAQLRYFNAGLTKAFTLATWDQRGAGKSFLYNPAPGNMSLNQIVSDAHELTEFLKNKFKQKKIFLAGFSWGSIVGFTLAQKYPQDYIAYAGISQVINMKQGMAITQNWLADRAREKNDTETLKTVKRLHKGDSSLCNSSLGCFMKQYELVTKYNGAVFNPASELETEKAMTIYDDYKNYDWNKGFDYSAHQLEKDMFSVDFSNITKIDIPVYFMSGRHDWNVPAVLTEKFYQKLQAPYKEIIWFENSGHGPLEEEPEKFNSIMIEKLLSAPGLARIQSENK